MRPLFTLLCFLVLAASVSPGQRPPEVRQKQEPDLWLYVEPYEIRCEVMMPFHLMETLMPMPRAETDWLSVEEQQRYREDVLAMLSTAAPVSIDGLDVQPFRTRLVYFDRKVTTITEDVPPAPVKVDEASIGVIYTFSPKGRPNSATVSWTSFNAVLNRVRCTIYAGAEESRITLTERQPAARWSAAGGALPETVPAEPVRGDAPTNDEEARAIAEALLRNIYRAFDYRQEEQIYDALAESVTGDLLATIYLDMRRGLEIQAEGGAVARVMDVSVSDCALNNADSNSFTCTLGWTVTGRVEHWGHVHIRRNAYAAHFRLVRENGSWRFLSMDLSRQERLSAETSLRQPAGEAE